MAEPILDEMEFEKQLSSMKDREIIEFTARKVYRSSLLLTSHEDAIEKLKQRDAKALSIGGTVGGTIGASMAAIVYWILTRFGR